MVLGGVISMFRRITVKILASKSGVLVDNWFVVVFIFTFIVNLALVSVIWYHIDAEVQNLPSDVADDVVKQRISDMGDIFLFLDKLVPLVFVLLWGLAIWFSIRTAPTHPLGFFFSLFALAFYTLISIVLVDFSGLFFDNSVFLPIIDQLSNSLFFAFKLHYISFFIMVVSLVIFYSKSKAGIEVGVQ